MTTTAKAQRGWSGFLFLLFVFVAGVWGFNYVSLQMPMTQVVEGDPRNEGISVSLHYGNFVDPSVLVYDLTGITGEKSRADVFRVFCQYANRVKDQSFGKVILAHNGQPKFQMDGSYFHTIGEEYGVQNPVYTVRTFPEHLYRPDGTRAFEQWEGGLLGVVKAQVEDFNSFHDQWYMGGAIANGVGGN